MEKMRSSGKGRGWNFRKGAKDVPSVEELRERGRKGGMAQVPKGFSDRTVMQKAIETRQRGGNDKEITA